MRRMGRRELNLESRRRESGRLQESVRLQERVEGVLD